MSNKVARCSDAHAHDPALSSHEKRRQLDLTDLARGLEERDGRSENAHGREEQHGGEADEREHLHGDQTLAATVAKQSTDKRNAREHEAGENAVRPSLNLSRLSLALPPSVPWLLTTCGTPRSRSSRC